MDSAFLAARLISLLETHSPGETEQAMLEKLKPASRRGELECLPGCTHLR